MKRSDLDTFTVLREVAISGQMIGYHNLCKRFPIKIVDAAFDREVSAGHLNYGVSLRTSWLEPKGKAWLAEHAPEQERQSRETE